MSSSGHHHDEVIPKIWDTTAPGFSFPEVGDPDYNLPDLMHRPNVGIAFSGGGTRSASATLGQLRALHHLNLLKNVRYISCVSGGAFTCIPYIYLPDNRDDTTFLGEIIPPEKLTVGRTHEIARRSFAYQIANAVIFDDFLKHAVRLAGDETYARAIGSVFLDPLGLGSLRRFFSWSDDSVAAILRHNPALSYDDFYTASPGRPFLITSSTLVQDHNETPLPDHIHFETTPLYAGAPVLHRGAGSNGQDIGGGYVEPFGFDSETPSAPNAWNHVAANLNDRRYTLSDMMGVTSAAPVKYIKRYLDWLGFPEFEYWSPPDAGTSYSEDIIFGDGGVLENLGIMSLLMRKVERIVVFINTQDELIGAARSQINDSLPPLFGQIQSFMTNHVFPSEQYHTLVYALMAQKDAGQTVMFRDRYPVLRNDHYGIEGGWEVEILWVYNEKVGAWHDQLPGDTQKLFEKKSLKKFPHYKTVMQNPPYTIDLSNQQVVLLTNLSCWNVMSNAGAFEAMLG